MELLSTSTQKSSLMFVMVQLESRHLLLGHGACNDSGELEESGNIRSTKAGQLPYSQKADAANPPSRSRAVDYCNGSLPHSNIYGRKATQCTRPDLRMDLEPLDLEMNQEVPDPDAKCDQSTQTGECVLASEAAYMSSPRSRVSADLSANPALESRANAVETALPHYQPSFLDPRSLQAADLH
jgi:hypothetical protein